MRYLSLPPAASVICHGGPAPQASGVFLMAFRHGAASLQTLRHGGPASNKPHSAEKSPPVWLAIWRIWAGFANSQLRRATFRSTY